MESPNALWVEYLLQLKKDAEEKGNKNGASIYTKCLRSIKKYPIPFMTATELVVLDGFGDKICAEVDELHRQFAEEHKISKAKLAQIVGDIPQSWVDVHDNLLQPPAPKRAPKKFTAPKDLVGPTQPMTQIFTQPTHSNSGSKGVFGPEVTLVVDNREISGVGRGKKKLKEMLEKIPQNEFIFNHRTLAISDFCFCRGDVVTIMLERKRIDDLAASIKDNRYKDQKKRLKQTATYTPFFLIEYKRHTGHMPFSTVTQGIANIAFYNHFKLVFTESMTETCAMLREMAKHIKNFKEPQKDDIALGELQAAAERRKPYTKHEQMINLFQCFHGMTLSKAVKLAEDVGHLNNLKHGIEGIVRDKNYLTPAMKKQLTIYFKAHY